MRTLLALIGVLFFGLTARTAAAQERVSTCVHVEAPGDDANALTRLVASEVDRHASHHVVTAGCATHLKVELIVLGDERFLTGRVGGEVPERVRVEGKDGKALESALTSLLRVVLGTDPVALRVPGGQSWVGEHVLALRDHGRTTLDFTALESMSWVGARATFRPALALGLSREIADWQVGIDAALAQRLEGHAGRADLDTQIRLEASVAHFFSADADTSGFVGLTLGVAHQRFSGPRAADAGGGQGAYSATGPALGFRCGVELLRTTSMRAFVLAEALAPLFVASDQDGEVVSGWVPGLALGAGARF